MNGTVYYYITNLQGDVMQVVDASGNAVATYDYDPYGRVISATGTLAEINPIRYRGYYYDTETGMYYLQSRYYDPVVCRYINGDAYISSGSGLLGYNMFAYCNNNPTILLDTSGTWPSASKVLMGIAYAAATVAVAAAVVVATPVLAGLGGLAAVATTVAYSAATVAVATGAMAVASAAVEKKVSQQTKSYTIYTLSDPITDEVKYVHQTMNSVCALIILTFSERD